MRQAKKGEKEMGYYRNTIEDLYSGHFKNSYGVEGMCVTGRSDYKKIVDVSDEMKTHVLEDTKRAYYKYNGMSGGNDAEEEAYARGLNEYYKTLDKEDRLSAAWTLGQLRLELSREVINGIREKLPDWKAGDPIPTDMLDEIFAGEKIASILEGKSEAVKEEREPREDRLTLEQPDGNGEADTEERSGKVAFNQEKRARQLSSAKTPSQVQVVISLLKKDLSDCEAGLQEGMCDENEVRKVKAMLQKAMERQSQVAGKEPEQGEESGGSFLINMLM